MLKTILDFVLNEERLNLFFFNMLWLAPVLGLILGTIIGLLTKQHVKHAIIGSLIGLAGTMISALWYIYNTIMDHFGLDSVAGLLINLCLFISIGLALGWVIRKVMPQPGRSSPAGDDHGESGRSLL